MALNGLFCADVPLRNYSLTPTVLSSSFYNVPFSHNTSFTESIIAHKARLNGQPKIDSII